MPVEDGLPLSRKRSLAAYEDDRELCHRPTPSVDADDGLRHTNRLLLLDLEQNESRKRVRTSEENEEFWAVGPQEASSDTDEDFDSESDSDSTFSPREVAPPA